MTNTKQTCASRRNTRSRLPSDRVVSTTDTKQLPSASLSLISRDSSIREKLRHCCKSIPKHSNVSHVKARYALCESENCGASAHRISTRGWICG